MKVLKEICLFSGAEFVLYTGTDFLVKTKEDVRLLGMDGKVKARRALPVYVSKIIRGRDGTFLLLPSLFAKEAYHMSGDLKDLETIPLPTDSESYLRDGCFLVDGSFLLLAEEKTGSYLLHCRKDGDVFVLFRGDGHHWTGIRFSEFFNSAILFSPRGKASFLAGGCLVREAKIPQCHTVLPFGKGNVLLADAPLGFYLLSGTGRILKRLDFLIDKGDKTERFAGLLLSQDRRYCLYLTRHERGEAVYLFSTKDFSLLDYRIGMKKEIDGLYFDGRYAYLRKGSDIVCCDFVEKVRPSGRRNRS